MPDRPDLKLVCFVAEMEAEPGVDLTCLAGHTLLVAAVSVGNAGQLGCDVLLASLQPQLLTQLHHPAIIPACGSDPLGRETGLFTAAQALVITVNRVQEFNACRLLSMSC